MSKGFLESSRSGARIFSAALALVAWPPMVFAQTAAPTQQETISLLVQQVQQLQQQDHDLQERIKVLEAGQKTVAPTVEPVPVPTTAGDASAQTATPAASPGQSTAAPSSLPEMHEVRAIQWRGFGEADYRVLNQRQPELATYGFQSGSAGNFYTGDFGLFLTARLTEKTSVLSEIVFGEADAQSYTVNLRRVLLKYDRNDHLKMSFGRYQTSIGYYNWAFRSAAWLQTTADRPLVMEYASNGGLLPTQAVGVSVTGAVPSGKLGLNYIAEYGTSDTIRPDINGDGAVTDENNGNQTNLGFFIRPDALRGLQMGGSYYHDKISNFALGPSVRDGQTIVNSYAVYIARGFEFLNEAFLIRHAPLHATGSVFNTPAFYSQLSRNFGPIRPFVRYQYVNASPRNEFYDDVGLRYGPSFGARYDLNDYVAFKAQLDHTLRGGQPDLNGLHLQLAFTF
jgi:hypothetical protein